MGSGVLRAQEKSGGGVGGVACMHKIYRAQTQVRREMCLAVLGKRGQGKGHVPGLSDLSSFFFVFFLSWSMSQVLASQGPSKFFPSSPFGSWRYGALGDVGAQNPA